MKAFGARQKGGSLNPMWIRLATNDDLHAMARVDPAIDHDGYRRALITQALGAQSCWVAGRDGNVEAYAAMSRGHFYGRDFISLVLVMFEARRRGLASALIG